jgi:glyoxylase-like metal-dependent hydrolase (beta-lactamase superfamily II)
MEQPTLLAPRKVAADLYEIASYLPVPGLGILPVNAFVVRGAQPMLVDTGLGALAEPFARALESVIDPADLRWIWISHLDADHIGNLPAVLERAPAARVVTSFLGMGKMMLMGLPAERVHLVEAGAPLDIGDRTLIALRPPYYDAPESLGWFDPATRALFAADAFGALMQAPVEEAGALAPEALREGLLAWSAIDAPWLQHLDAAYLARTVDALRRLDPAVIVSAHLPHACGMTSDLAGHLVEAAGNAPAAGAEAAGMHEALTALERAA